MKDFPSQSFIAQESNNDNECLNFQRTYVLDMIFEIFYLSFINWYISLIIIKCNLVKHHLLYYWSDIPITTIPMLVCKYFIIKLLVTLKYFLQGVTTNIYWESCYNYI